VDDKAFSAFLDRWIPEHKDEMVQSLLGLLRIDSVGAPPLEGKPFGTEVDRAILYFISEAEKYGLKTRNVDGYAAHAEVGEGKEMAMALTHVDIVPAGTGWDHDPFGEVHEGMIYGRGTTDNKGPTVANLFALRALKEAGVPLKRRVRHVVGGNEESGFRCVRHYFEVEEQPTFGFSPDAAFPLVFAEKGSMKVQIEFELPKALSGDATCRLVEFCGGERSNIVASKGVAVLEVPNGAEKDIVEELETRVPSARDLTGGPAPLEFLFEYEIGKITVTAKGKAAHAASPEEGTNALIALAYVLSTLGERLETAPALRFISDAGNIHGKGLCIDSEDDISGKLTCNLGTAAVEEEEGKRTVRVIYDIRYPVKVPGDKLKERAEGCPRPDSVKLTVLSVGKPHYTDPDSFLVKELLRVYREETGDMSPPIAIGGGTYAKVIPGGVAYGPGKPGTPELAHQANEAISVDDLMQLVRIYARALFALAT
jgi:succinyl-diaminopimelate desuccinylase